MKKKPDQRKARMKATNATTFVDQVNRNKTPETKNDP